MIWKEYGLSEVSNVFDPIEVGKGSVEGRLAEFEDTEGSVVKLLTYVRKDDGAPHAVVLHEEVGYGIVLRTDDCNNWQATAVFSLVPVKSNKFRYSKFDAPRDVEYGTPLSEALIEAETHTPGFLQAFAA